MPVPLVRRCARIYYESCADQFFAWLLIPVNASARPRLNKPILVIKLPNIDRLFAPIGRVRSTPVTGMSTGALVIVRAGGARVTMLVGVLVAVPMKPGWAVRVVVGLLVMVAVVVGSNEAVTFGWAVRVTVGVCVFEGSVTLAVGVNEGIT